MTAMNPLSPLHVFIMYSSKICVTGKEIHNVKQWV
jgi:hypothetical protein